ncbi:MAG: prepilin-type N-terminal cleavage/methylation domain-containing protein, partial [Oscillospiraceae bacterium]
MTKKLRSKKGFTLSELLVTLAILGVLTLAIAVGISSAATVYRQSVTLSESGVLASTLSQAVADELHYAREIKGTDTVTYTSQTYGANASIRAENGRLKVGSYQLVGDAAYTNLKANVGITYTVGSRAFKVEITIIGQDN